MVDDLNDMNQKSDKGINMDKSINTGRRLAFLPVGMVFQFLFTVCGGGCLIAGIIAGCKVGWNMELENNLGRISLLLVIFGAAFFVIGIGISVILFKAATSTPEE